jgi:hypothetical protein
LAIAQIVHDILIPPKPPQSDPPPPTGRNGAERLAPENRAAAMDRACLLKPILADLTGAGMSIRQIAAELTARGIPTAKGGKWHPQTVSRMLERVAE